MIAAQRKDRKSGDAKAAAHPRSPLLKLPMKSVFSGNQKTRSFWRLRRQTPIVMIMMEDENQDLRQNASQSSTNRQFYPLIETENLSELPEPPLTSVIDFE